MAALSELYRYSPTRPHGQRWKHAARSAGLRSHQIFRERTMQRSNACARSGSASWSEMLQTMWAWTWMRMMRTLMCAPPRSLFCARARARARARVYACARVRAVRAIVSARKYTQTPCSAVQGSESDAEVTSKKRKATKRRSTRTQGGKRQAVSLSKNFNEVRPAVYQATHPLLLQASESSSDVHTAARDYGVRQVSQARSKLPVHHHHATAPSAAALLRRVRRGGAVHPSARWCQVRVCATWLWKCSRQGGTRPVAARASSAA